MIRFPTLTFEHMNLQHMTFFWLPHYIQHSFVENFYLLLCFTLFTCFTYFLIQGGLFLTVLNLQTLKVQDDEGCKYGE